MDRLSRWNGWLQQPYYESFVPSWGNVRWVLAACVICLALMLAVNLVIRLIERRLPPRDEPRRQV